LAGAWLTGLKEELMTLSPFRRKLTPNLHGTVVWLIAVGLLLAGSRAGAQEQRAPFSAGEKLRYSVSWRLLPAGNAEIVLNQERAPAGGTRWRVTGKAESVGYVSNIYKVQDEYQSTFRNTPLCSTGLRKTIHEGGRHREVKLDFDSQPRAAKVEEKNIQTGTIVRNAQFPTPACVQDIISALYYVRTRPLVVGQTIDVPINDGGKTIQLRVEVQAEEDVKTELGTIRAIRVEPAVFDGKLFSGKGRMHVWFAKDAQRVPVQLRAQIAVGTITAIIAGIEREETTR
jgi:hypothetical protein